MAAAMPGLNTSSQIDQESRKFIAPNTQEKHKDYIAYLQCQQHSSMAQSIQKAQTHTAMRTVYMCPCWDMYWKCAWSICALAGTCAGTKEHLYGAQQPVKQGLLWAQHAHAATRQAEFCCSGRCCDEQLSIRCVRQCTSEPLLQIPDVSSHQALLHAPPVVADGQVDGAVVAGALAQLPPSRALLPLVLRSRCQHLDHPRHRAAWPCQTILLSLA